MKVSVLIATYNRSLLLRRALASVIKQDYRDLEIIVVDDCSTDDTPQAVAEFNDDRIRYIRNEKNVGSVQGDIGIIRRFLSEYCTGEAFVYLCDDDYWKPDDLITRQVRELKRTPSLAFVQGGMVHCYPNPVPGHVPNALYVTYSFMDERKSMVFWGSLFPDGYLDRYDYLRMFAEDPKNRNIVIGATLFRTDMFKKSGALNRCAGVRWQGGFAIIGGAASQGDVYYMDEPCLYVEVRTTTASHSGTQFNNFCESLDSIDAAFTAKPKDEKLIEIRALMMRSIFKAFICNKIGHKAGWFERHPLGDISDIMLPAISTDQFIDEMTRRNVSLSSDNLKLLEMCEEPGFPDMSNSEWWPQAERMAS